MKIDMHVHTAEGSPCARIQAQEVVKAYSQTDYDGIVITNHFDNDLLKDFGNTERQRMERYLLGYDRAYETGMKYGIIVMLGIEIRLEPFAEDFLIYGVGKKFLYDNPNMCFLSQEELFHLCHEQGALLYQAHPFREPCNPRNPEFLDGVEFNQRPDGDNHNEYLEEWLRGYPHLKTVSGSDFHVMDNLGAGGIVTDKSVTTSEELAEYLRYNMPELITFQSSPNPICMAGHQKNTKNM